MAFNVAGAGTYYLGSSIGSTDTTILLSSFLEPVSGVAYTMALLNTDIVFATIAPGTSSSEFISFTGITQNANGTATLTGVTRGLAKKYPFTTSSTFKLPHSGQTIFILSDAPQVFNKYGTLDNNSVITGYWEAPDPITAQGLVTRDYMLALINGGTISQNQVIEAAIAGETVAAGNLLYFSETDNEWLKTDADTLATVFNVKLGISMGAGTNGNAITGGVLTFGTYTTSGLTQGDLCYASNTAGGINSGTAGTVPRVIGIAKDSTHLYFDPNFQNTLYAYAVDSVGTDAYAVTLAGSLSVPYVGMEVSFKAGTANTGAATLAINGGSAIALKKDASSALATGDILSGQIVRVQYDGTNWQIISNLPQGTVNVATQVTGVLAIANGGTGLATLNYNSGVVAIAATGTQNIAHGLGKTPAHIKITAYEAAGLGTTGPVMNSVGTYNGTNTKILYMNYTNAGSGNTQSNIDTSMIIYLQRGGGSLSTSATVTMDATNIILAVSNANPGFLLWEAWGF